MNDSQHILDHYHSNMDYRLKLVRALNNNENVVGYGSLEISEFNNQMNSDKELILFTSLYPRPKAYPF